MMTATSLETLN